MSSSVYKHAAFTHLRPIVYIHPYYLPRRRTRLSIFLSPSAKLDLLTAKPATPAAGVAPGGGKKDSDFFFLANFSFRLFQPSRYHFTPSSHVQLQLFPGKVCPGCTGAAAQVEGQELRLLHEDRLLLFLADPVSDHRQPGALPHLRAAGEVGGGEEGGGQWFLNRFL